MKNVLPIIENPYNLRKETKFKSRNAHTVRTALKLFLLLRQEFGAAFEEVTKNVVLLTNLKQKLNFGIQKTANENLAKITSIKQVIHRTAYLSFVDASVLCESLFRDRKVELSLFGNTFW